MSKRRRLKNRERVPPGGYLLVVPETKGRIRGTFLSFGQILKVYRDHLVSNSLPIPQPFEPIVEDLICQNLDEEYWYQEGDGWNPLYPAADEKDPTRHIKVRGSLSASKILGFTKALLGPIRKKKFVSEAEVMKRDRQCSKCPLRSNDPGGCFGCHSIIAPVLRFAMGEDRWERIGERMKTKNSICGACGCALRAKLHLNDEALVALTGPYDFRSLYRPGVSFLMNETEVSKDGTPCFMLDIPQMKEKYQDGQQEPDK